MLQLVPFNNQWANPGGTVDIKGVYRRGDAYAPELPIKRHLDWQAKGFEYITLSSAADVAAAKEKGVLIGVHDLADLRKSYEQNPLAAFKLADYIKELEAAKPKPAKDKA